jgi:hypothetical protein
VVVANGAACEGSKSVTNRQLSENLQQIWPIDPNVG